MSTCSFFGSPTPHLLKQTTVAIARGQLCQLLHYMGGTGYWPLHLMDQPPPGVRGMEISI